MFVHQATEKLLFQVSDSTTKSHYGPNEEFSTYLACDYKTQIDWKRRNLIENSFEQSLLINQSTSVGPWNPKLNRLVQQVSYLT